MRKTGILLWSYYIEEHIKSIIYYFSENKRNKSTFKDGKYFGVLTKNCSIVVLLMFLEIITLLFFSIFPNQLRSYTILYKLPTSNNS